MVKLASDDATSRGTGVGMGAYYREVAFYENLAGRLGDSVPACHLATYDPGEGWFTLVLEDVAGAVQGDQIAGCSVAQARQALDALARIHGPVLNDLALSTADWLNLPNPLNQELLTQLWPAFRERYADWVTDEHAAVIDRFLPSLEGWYADTPAAAGARARRLQAGQPAVRGRELHGGGLADGDVGAGHVRRLVLPGHRPDRGRPPRPRGGDGARLPRCAAGAGCAEPVLGPGLGGVPAGGLQRTAADRGRRHRGGADRTRRPDVRGLLHAHVPAGAGPGCAGASARARRRGA